MTYRALYEHSQAFEPPISRNVARDKVKELLKLPRIASVRTKLDTRYCRGFYIAPQNQRHKIVQQLGSHVIVLPRDTPPDYPGLNYCWERFVYTKELMHIFDTVDEATDTGEAFDTVLSELMMPSSPKWSPQMLSEMDCFWMALGVLCPEKVREKFGAERAANQLDDYSIALQLRIPEQYVPNLFQPWYGDRIKALLD
jgi:hypothetical protein